MLGFINIYKPSGMTSSDVVRKIKKKFHISKIGHMGTLDPMACGILPIAIGKATRLFDYSLNKTKKYIAEFEFGYTTDTLDITGVEVGRTNVIPSYNDIVVACETMIGKQLQIPPMYSAKNVNGVRAYDLARQGITVELKPKEIEILSMKCLSAISSTKYQFEIVCGSGTYIRSIARDLGEKLNSLACMSALERVATGEFNIETSIQLDDLLNCDNLSDCILSPLQVFKNFDIINIDDACANKLLNGRLVEWNELSNPAFVVWKEKILGVATPRVSQLTLGVYLYEE